MINGRVFPGGYFWYYFFASRLWPRIFGDFLMTISKKLTLTSALVLGLASLAPFSASAQYANGYNNSNSYSVRNNMYFTLRSSTPLLAGPGRSYPTVVYANRGQRVRLHGCLDAYAWCDVSYDVNETVRQNGRYITARYSVRGWVDADDITVWRHNRAYDFYDASEWYRYPVVSFLFDQYWSNNYRNQRWYNDRTRYRNSPWQNDRERWHRHGTDRPRDRDRNGDWDGVDRNDRDGRDWDGDGRDQDRDRSRTRPTTYPGAAPVTSIPPARRGTETGSPVYQRRVFETRATGAPIVAPVAPPTTTTPVTTTVAPVVVTAPAPTTETRRVRGNYKRVSEEVENNQN